jgi:hypothetical protein
MADYIPLLQERLAEVVVVARPMVMPLVMPQVLQHSQLRLIPEQ